MHDLQVFADDSAFRSHANTDLPEIAFMFQGLFSNYNIVAERALSGAMLANDPEGLNQKPPPWERSLTSLAMERPLRVLISFLIKIGYRRTVKVDEQKLLLSQTSL